MQPIDATSPNYYVVIDLGSNSFHMLIAQKRGEHLVVVNRVKQKVRLASGLDEQHNLSKISMERGWQCLQLFAEQLQQLDNVEVKIVATATIRLAKNASEFVEKGERILQHSINTISGLREAEYIYQGATSALPDETRNLVLDIGGASTEIVVGTGSLAAQQISLNLGCVLFMEKYFNQGEITQQAFDCAVQDARALIHPIKEPFLQHQWDTCFGASGTPQALRELKQYHQDSHPIDLDYLHQLGQKCIGQNMNRFHLDGLQDSRVAVFPGGLAILIALFEELEIESLSLAKGALREGILLELSGTTIA